MVDRNQLCTDLERDEGLRLKPYLDSVGVMTIGIGRNLQDVGISKAEAYMLLGADIDTACATLDRNLPWWRDMSEARQRALVNMCFNLGITRLMGFAKALAALKAGQYDEAARQFLDSRWASQVGKRAERIADLIRKG